MTADQEIYAVPHGGHPPDPPELPAGADAAPPWPAWFGFVAFFGALAVTLLLTAPLLLTDDPESPVVVQVSTVIQNVAFAAVALAMAALVQRPQARHFGLRRTRLWPAVGWAAAGLVAFYFFALAYGLAIGGVDEQSTADDVGADEGQLALIAAGILFIVVAPLGEEFFWRGFFYRGLRSSLSAAPAALVAGGVFGLIHLPAGPEAVPPLAVLGVMLCLVYERTGSLYPAIGIHAFNNTLAYAATTDAGVTETVAIGAPMLAASLLLPLVHPARSRVA